MPPTCPLLLPPEREYRFHPTRDFRLDFAWPDLKVGVEIHGGSFSRGRHNRGVGQFKDLFKINEAQRLGWIILQFNTLNYQNATRRDRMVEYVSIVLAERYDQQTQAANYVQDVNDILTYGFKPGPLLRNTPSPLALPPSDSGSKPDHKIPRPRPRVGTKPK